jgi:hypothetical protein
MKSRIKWQLTGFLGIFTFMAFQLYGAAAPYSKPVICPDLTSAIPGFSICTGDDTRDLSVFASSNEVDIQFVRFDVPQTGTDMYTGGTLIGTVQSGDFTPVGNRFQVLLEDVSFPPATIFTTYYVYAILRTSDPDATPGCLPSVEIMVKINPASGPILCQNIVQVSLDSTGNALIAPQDVLNSNSQNYPDYDIFSVKITLFNTNQSFGNTVTCSNIGQNLRATVTNTCTGNNCTATLRVQDKLPPVIRCEDISVSCAVSDFTPAYLKNTLGILAAMPNVNDNCGTAILSQTEVWNDLDCGSSYNGYDNLSGYLLRRWTARDASGNTSTCLQHIYDFRRDVSDVLFPADTTLPCTATSTAPNITGVPYLPESGQRVGLLPNTTYCELNAIFADQETQNCDGRRIILRKWTVYSWCKPISTDPVNPNPRHHTQIITVADNTGPQMTCPTDIMVSTGPNACCATVNLPDVLLTDNCSRLASAVATLNILYPETDSIISTMTFNGMLSDFPGNNLWNTDTLAIFGNSTCLPVGMHRISYTFSDDCGNTSSCSFKLSVRDEVPPVAACDLFTQITLGSDSTAFISAKTLDDGSYDNCSSAVWFKAYRMDGVVSCRDTNALNDYVHFCCADAGDTINVVLRVYDVRVDTGKIRWHAEMGQFNECMVRVLVEDKLAPVCTPPAHATIDCENFDPSLSAYGTAIWKDNCCVQPGTESVNYSQFDTSCNKGTIVRTFRAADCSNNTASCSQRIVVQYKQEYFLKMPDDVVIQACNGGNGNYGAPVFHGQDCEQLGVTFRDDTFTLAPDACLKIERNWKIINWCAYDVNGPCIEIPNPQPNANLSSQINLIGPIISAPGTLLPWTATILRITPSDPAPTNFSSFWSANPNCYTYKQIIKITDVQLPEAENCPTGLQNICDLSPNDTGLWKANYWWEPTLNSHDLCEGPADLKITGFDACTGADVNIQYLLFLDLDQDGVQETVINSANLPPVNTLFLGNALNPNFTGGTPRMFDQRNLPVSMQFRFAIQTTVAGGKKTAAVRWVTTNQPTNFRIPELPYGRHKIKWIITDGCGNERVCEYAFAVRDCKKPTILCKPISVNVMQTGMVTLWASDFLQYADDNCTPSSRLVYAVSHEGDFTGAIPTDALGNPLVQVSFTCADLGTQIVHLWARDLSGNADYCAAYVQVQDNLGHCLGRASVAGVLQTEIIEGVEEAKITLSGTHPALPPINLYQFSDDNGFYRFNNALPIGANYLVTPSKNDNPINGITTLDLSLISKHILNVQPLPSVYKMIAADANNSGTITTLDIVELRRLILGIANDFSNNTSWRFVPRSFVFTNPSDPFEAPFPEAIRFANMQASQLDRDFVSIKVGDVNDTTQPNNLTGVNTDDRSREMLLLQMTLQDSTSWLVQEGALVELACLAQNPSAGFQFTLQHPDVEVLEIVPDRDMHAGHFAQHMGAVTFSWNTESGSLATPTFILRLRAKKAGDLRKMLFLSNSITRTEAYLHTHYNAVPADIALAFRRGNETPVVQPVGFETYQNFPNPFAKRTSIGFYLPDAAHVMLRIFDETGRLVMFREGDFSAGHSAFLVEQPGANATLTYRIETPYGVGVGKMVRIEED